MMILRITAEEIETKLGGFFGKIGKFFVGIYEAVVGTLDKFLPHQFTLMLLIVVAAIIILYIFTQKINK